MYVRARQLVFPKPEAFQELVASELIKKYRAPSQHPSPRTKNQKYLSSLSTKNARKQCRSREAEGRNPQPNTRTQIKASEKSSFRIGLCDHDLYWRDDRSHEIRDASREETEETTRLSCLLTRCSSSPNNRPRYLNNERLRLVLAFRPTHDDPCPLCHSTAAPCPPSPPPSSL